MDASQVLNAVVDSDSEIDWNESSGVLLLMGIHQLPPIADYWSTHK